MTPAISTTPPPIDLLCLRQVGAVESRSIPKATDLQSLPGAGKTGFSDFANSENWMYPYHRYYRYKPMCECLYYALAAE